MGSDDLASLRTDYSTLGLDESAAGSDPVALFGRWLDEAVASGLHEPNAMALATATPDGRPSVRLVLLKGFDRRGFVFYTHDGSRKGRELAANPEAALVFPWHPLSRQVRAEGEVHRVDAAESDAYFASRPRGSQLGAWASPQSSVVADRAELDDAYEREIRRYRADEPVPRPPRWGGYRLQPRMIEFWVGRASRMHDRVRFTRAGDAWTRDRLAP
ncbi:MAG: pyridoxamine 5'-phosphate oxidase [Nocardioidaceae bacterium]